MPQTNRQPTSLKRLEEILTDGNWPEADDDVFRWLQWAHNQLSSRNLYHKKARIKDAILRKMAETLLSEDELQTVDEEAESKL